jgi:hypothetical protein
VIGITDSLTLGTELGTPSTSGGYFIAKHGPTGNLLWFSKAGGGGSTTTEGWDVALDPSGNSYVSGYTTSSSLGTELGTASSAGEYFIAKHGPAGDLLWIKQVGGGGSTNTAASAVATDSSGNSYVTGKTNSSSLGTELGTSTSGTGLEYFLAKHGPTGNLLWIKQAGGGNATDTEGFGVAVDSSGNSYVSGYTTSSSLGTEIGTASSGSAYYIAKHGPTGNLIWLHKFGGGGSTFATAYSITVDSTDNVYVTGDTNSSILGTELGTASTGSEYFIAKYGPTGSLIWNKRVGGGGNTYTTPLSIKVDSNGNSYLTGHTPSTLFGTQLGPTSSGDIPFVSKHGPTGELLWSHRFGAGGSTSVYPGKLAVDSTGSSYVTGATFSHTLGIQLGDPGATTGQEYFLIKVDTSGSLQ